MSTPYHILLYYKFVPIEDPQQFAKEHLDLCNQLELKGRIIVAPEGINGTVSGLKKNTKKYMNIMHAHPLFQDMKFKIDHYHQHAFKKMHVRPKKELVTFRVKKELNPNKKTGKYLSPKEFYQLLQQDDVIVLDGRNNYEYDIGHFRRAIRPNVNSFREFPEWIRQNMSSFKDRKILTYCTGGIRCEKLTAYMIEEGFENVYQLNGGIITYGKDPEIKGKLFDGKCYVFDQRISVPINQHQYIVVGTCHHCKKPTEQYINCNYDPCHKQHLCCEDCMDIHQGYCSEKCRSLDYSEVLQTGSE